MGNFNAKFTDDGSIGLFSDVYNDIYHSRFGALSEAYEKFILPAGFSEFLNKNSEIKILDICYGIGYNTKSFLNYYFNNFYKKNLNSNFQKKFFSTKFIKHINSIYTDNIYALKNKKNSINQKNHKIILHAVELDENLVKLSPFIKNPKFCLKTLGKNNLFSGLNKKDCNKFYIREEINHIILLKLLEQYKSDFFNKEIDEILTDKANKKFFSQKMVNLAKNHACGEYDLSYLGRLNALLHNIYYKYISNSYKNAQKTLKNGFFDIDLYNQDARRFIKNSNMKYDFIFLDAFSPDKAPNLWTFEFFTELYKHLSDDGIILTYSNSTAVRNAFYKNKFYVGKIYNKYENRFTGTIASKNIELIKYPLDDFETGLLNTKSAICYHDNSDLTLENSAILENRQNEVNVSNLISTSHYKKEYKCHTM
ncbi:hypothetical protein IJ818_05755 [bacterium]|nr:hypothetical protein [bacterium]